MEKRASYSSGLSRFYLYFQIGEKRTTFVENATKALVMHCTVSKLLDSGVSIFLMLPRISDSGLGTDREKAACLLSASYESQIVPFSLFLWSKYHINHSAAYSTPYVRYSYLQSLKRQCGNIGSFII